MAEKCDSDKEWELHEKLYVSYKTLNESICRKILLLIFSQSGQSLNESSRSLLNNKTIMTRLDDLIHNSYMTAVH